MRLDNLRGLNETERQSMQDVFEESMLRYGRYLSGRPVLGEAVGLEGAVDPGPVEADNDVPAEIDDRNTPLT